MTRVHLCLCSHTDLDTYESGGLPLQDVPLLASSRPTFREKILVLDLSVNILPLIIGVGLFLIILVLYSNPSYFLVPFKKVLDLRNYEPRTWFIRDYRT